MNRMASRAAQENGPASLAPAQKAAMAAGYGPLTPEAAERLAPGGMVAQLESARRAH